MHFWRQVKYFKMFKILCIDICQPQSQNCRMYNSKYIVKNKVNHHPKVNRIIHAFTASGMVENFFWFKIKNNVINVQYYDGVQGETRLWRSGGFEECKCAVNLC